MQGIAQCFLTMTLGIFSWMLSIELPHTCFRKILMRRVAPSHPPFQKACLLTGGCTPVFWGDSVTSLLCSLICLSRPSSWWFKMCLEFQGAQMLKVLGLDTTKVVWGK